MAISISLASTDSFTWQLSFKSDAHFGSLPPRARRANACGSKINAPGNGREFRRPHERARLAPQAAAAAAHHEQAEDVLVWIKCTRCPHMAAVAIAPYIICWGPDGWQDMLRRYGRCTACGTEGVGLQHPSWGGNDTGWAPMPVSQMAPVSEMPPKRT